MTEKMNEPINSRNNFQFVLRNILIKDQQPKSVVMGLDEYMITVDATITIVTLRSFV
jgi:hypothetical protein